jgi:hypothetical protein
MFSLNFYILIFTSQLLINFSPFFFFLFLLFKFQLYPLLIILDWYRSTQRRNKPLRLNSLDAWWTVDWYERSCYMYPSTLWPYKRQKLHLQLSSTRPKASIQLNSAKSFIFSTTSSSWPFRSFWAHLV